MELENFCDFSHVDLLGRKKSEYLRWHFFKTFLKISNCQVSSTEAQPQCVSMEDWFIKEKCDTFFGAAEKDQIEPTSNDEEPEPQEKEPPHIEAGCILWDVTQS